MNFPKSSVSGMPSCTKSVTLRLLNEVVKLKQDRVVAVNGQDVDELPVWIDGINIRHASSVFVAGNFFIYFHYFFLIIFNSKFKIQNYKLKLLKNWIKT